MWPWTSQWKHRPSFFSFSWCSVRGRRVWAVSTSIGTELSFCFPFKAAFHCCFLSFPSFGDLASPRFFLIAYRLFSSLATSIGSCRLVLNRTVGLGRRGG